MKKLSARLFFTPNESMQALHEIGEERIAVSNELRWRGVLKARRSKIHVENRGHGMERLQTVKTWSLSALASRLFDWAFDIEVREVLDQKKRSHCCFTVTKPRQPLALDITVIARGGSDLPQRGQFHVL